MSYTSRQAAQESQQVESSANKVVSPKFNDQRASTSVQLKQQQLMQAAQAPAQLAAEEEEPLQGKFVAQRVEEEEPLQGKFVAQRAEEEEPLQGKFATAQLAGMEEEEPIQGKFETLQRVAEEEEPLQAKFSSAAPVQREQKPNNTGMPDNLKSGIENLSGYSMDDVKVHYNSDKPAQLNAHAYAQGTDIHVAPGQEQHLPHEAWHVVQQKQGRVQPTMQMKAGVPVNDDAGLESEADVMGAKAVQQNAVSQMALKSGARLTSEIAQRRDILGSTRYTANFKMRHVRADNVTEDVAAARLANDPAPPSSTVIDQSTVPKSVKKFEDSNKISEKFQFSAGGWNAYFGRDGSVRAKKIQNVTVSKDDTAIINHLDSCTEQGTEKVRQPDGTWL